MQYIRYWGILIIVTLGGCSHSRKESNISSSFVHIYPTVSYLDIQLDSNGRLPTNPYVLTFENEKKQIRFCGTNHVGGDVEHPMYQIIEKEFFEFRPDICINEGGDVSKASYTSKEEAIRKSGEIGLAKILSDSLGIQTVNGDISDSLEFKELLKKYTKGEFLAYIAIERLMWGLPEDIAESELRREYDVFILDYIIEQGKVSLDSAERTLEFFTSNYQNLLNRPFDLQTLEPTNPFDPDGEFQEIGRASKEIRDQHLLRTIDELLNRYDNVFVIFGGWHLLACEPGLKEIIDRRESKTTKI